MTAKNRAKGTTYACQLQHFGSQVFEDGRDVDCGLGTDSHLVLSVLLEETLHTTARELYAPRKTPELATVHRLIQVPAA